MEEGSEKQRKLEWISSSFEGISKNINDDFKIMRQITTKNTSEDMDTTSDRRATANESQNSIGDEIQDIVNNKGDSQTYSD